MTYLFCDTCVFLNLATDIKLYDVVQKLIELVDTGQIKVVMSDVVKSELSTHKETIVDKRIKSYSGHLKNIKNLYELFSEETEQVLRKEIEKVQQDLPQMQKVLDKSLGEVIELANKSTQIAYSDKHKVNVIQKGIEKNFLFIVTKLFQIRFDS